ncbi:sigma-54-dependent transcriptional regulator [Marinibactrum halimedae]|uniref:Sigma-54-dependent Fis family transcriptional regulator n=1 Tax=Marinibactrum halimedae TaxID=1444977 RepID=A0AA37WKP0_9GAMM|nr:sigma-54 dependent transcriptional regulator [Marinibactrum halimedae]MCD9458179.1 sigma-54 dependent transcriptional regulator [Marinibactrum halimedae]GLS25113.1 sigma-54-dependent Fis family transcriptional regulator [Marinibactrum halimedae]
MANKLLIIEDDSHTSGELSRYYRQKGWLVSVADGVAEARRLLDKEFNPHVILADLGLPDGSILDHFEDIHADTDHSEWVFAFESNSRTNIDRIDELAYEFIEKPINQSRLDVMLKRALRASLTARRLANYSNSDSQLYHFDAYIGHSEAVSDLKDMLKRLMDVPISTMIITGETGTGKGLTARIIHNNGLRKDGPLVELNCAALPKELMESHLFGHESGAFTGAKGRHRGLIEQADGGTLFLDEIGDMDLDLQAKLLKAIEDKRIRRLGGEREISVDVQIIAATGIDLEQASRDNRFRDDLYHRLSVFCITLPPLRERKNDLVELVPRIIAEFNSKANRRVEVVPDQVWDQLLAYDWPGNIRELRNVVERCVLLSSDEIFPSKWLQLTDNDSQEANVSTVGIPTDSIVIPLDGSMALDEMDSHIIQNALELNDFNITETARVLGTTRETLRYRVQKYGLNTSA